MMISVFHYVWIKDLSCLVSTQLSKRDGQKYFCDRCQHYFRNDSKLNLHEQDCLQLNKCKVILLTPKDNILQLKNFNHKEKVPFVIYADFECLLKAVQIGNAYQEHEAFSIGYYLKCSYDDSLSHYSSYRGKDPAKWFAEQLQSLLEHFKTIFKCIVPMETLNLKQKQAFRKTSLCHICDKPLTLITKWEG